MMDTPRWWAIMRAKLESGGSWLQGWLADLLFVRWERNLEGSQSEQNARSFINSFRRCRFSCKTFIACNQRQWMNIVTDSYGTTIFVTYLLIPASSATWFLMVCSDELTDPNKFLRSYSEGGCLRCVLRPLHQTSVTSARNASWSFENI